VIQDRYGRTVEDVESIRAPRPGEDLITSIDLRIQYLAYRELKAAVLEQQAKGGSVVVLDVDSGEVLAMVNQPAYNPNDRDQVAASRYRNRAATDIFEPGSSIKPFIAASGIASGRFHPDTIIDTSPGMVRVGIKSITDHHNLGAVPLTTIIAKSSNVGMTKMAMTLSPQSMADMLRAFGFGEVTGSGFPGESAGLLYDASHWRKIEQATISYGYGLSVTPLQLARAYAILGAGGVRRPVTLRRVDGPVQGERVIDERVARELLRMMESVVSQDGATGTRAALVGYRVAGKTGTAWTADAGGYSSDRYKASFGGVVPASHPRLAAIVVIDEPGGKLFYGGDVAAPVFANVMAGALRLLGVPPDGLDRVPATTLVQASRVP
jgi:cell division protein FtsI (penicillin-binding protein 3)